MSDLRERLIAAMRADMERFPAGRTSTPARLASDRADAALGVVAAWLRDVAEMRDSPMAALKRMRQERDEAAARSLVCCEKFRPELDNALAEVAHLREELAMARASERAALAAEAGRRTPVIAGWERLQEAAAERDSWQRMAERMERDYAALAARLERAEAERDAMRAVVEAAPDAAIAMREWTVWLPGGFAKDARWPPIERLIVAIDTYRAATPSTEAGP